MNNLPDWLVERLTQRWEAMGGWDHHQPSCSPWAATRGQAPDGQLTYPGPNVPIDSTHLGHWMREVLDMAGLTWAIPHTFRRTAATLLHEAGIPLAAIADQLGHVDPTVTMSVYLGRELEGDKSALAAVL